MSSTILRTVNVALGAVAFLLVFFMLGDLPLSCGDDIFNCDFVIRPSEWVDKYLEIMPR